MQASYIAELSTACTIQSGQPSPHFGAPSNSRTRKLATPLTFVLAIAAERATGLVITGQMYWLAPCNRSE